MGTIRCLTLFWIFVYHTFRLGNQPICHQDAGRRPWSDAFVFSQSPLIQVFPDAAISSDHGNRRLAVRISRAAYLFLGLALSRTQWRAVDELLSSKFSSHAAIQSGWLSVCI